MKPVTILLVEDNEGDIILTLDALEECRISNDIIVKRDGEQAVNLFKNLTNPDDAPDLVLLDINLPKVSGHEVLVYLKNDERFKHIPVIILSTSSSETDISKSYKNHVNCFITKPVDVENFIKAIAKIEDFWINIVSIPR